MLPEKSFDVLKDKQQVLFVAKGRPAEGKDRAKVVRTRNLALHSDAGPIYQVAALFKERCLREDSSLLFPGSRTWTIENLERLSAVFETLCPQPDDKFYRIWQQRLSDEPAGVHRVAADLVAFYNLLPADLTGEAKMRRLKRVILWKLSDNPPELDFLERPYASYIGTTGRLYFACIAEHFSFFLAFANAAKTAKANLDDVQSAKVVAAEVSEGRKYASVARNVLLHLLFPNEIEGILSQAHRDKILSAFPEFAGNAEDPDVALRNIRTGLKAKFGRSDFDYYRPDIRALWDLDTPTKPRPQTFRHRGKEHVGDRVYLRESGGNGRMIGVAEVAGFPGTPPFALEQRQLAFTARVLGGIVRILAKLFSGFYGPSNWRTHG